jgi:hypothetical protein
MNFYNKIMEEKKMSLQMKEKRKDWQGLYGLVVAFAVALIFFGSYQKADAQQKTFKSSEEAVKSLMDALRSNNTKELLAIFGTAGKEIISSGDKGADKAGRERFGKGNGKNCRRHDKVRP